MTKPKTQYGDPVGTVGELIELLSKFPKDMPVRLSIPEGMNDRYSPECAWISNGLHEWGLIADDLWSDSCGSHRVCQIPVFGNEVRSGKGFVETYTPNPRQAKKLKMPKKYLVKRAKNDPDGTGSYF